MSDSEYQRVLFELEPDEDGWPPSNGETLWAISVENGYKLDNIPFFAPGVALDDVVDGDPLENVIVFRRVVSRGGHATFRILAKVPDIPAIRAELLELGCESEGSGIPGLISVDVPPDVDRKPVETYLIDGGRSKRFEVETGYCDWYD